MRQLVRELAGEALPVGRTVEVRVLTALHRFGKVLKIESMINDTSASQQKWEDFGYLYAVLLERLAEAELDGKIRGNDQISQIVRVRKVVRFYVGRVPGVPRPEADSAAALGMQKARHYAKSVLERYFIIARLLKWKLSHSLSIRKTVA